MEKKADEPRSFGRSGSVCACGQKVNQGDALEDSRFEGLGPYETLLSDTFQFSEIPVNTD